MRQVIASESDQAANVESGLLSFVATHRAIALLDPPANAAFAAIVSAVQVYVSIFISPGTIGRKSDAAWVPTVQEQITHPIGNVKAFAFCRLASVGVRQIQVCCPWQAAKQTVTGVSIA